MQPAERRNNKFEFLRDNLGWLTSLSYVVLTGVGLVYEIWYFRTFGISILDYGQPLDFLLAGFREPALFFLSLLSLAVLFGIYRVDEAVKLRSLKYAKASQRLEDSRFYSRSVVFTILTFAYFTVFAFAYATFSAQRVANGHARHVIVHLTNEQDDGSKPPLLGETLLIGTTSQFIFLFKADKETVQIVPTNAVSRIEVKVPKNPTPPKD